MSYCQKCGAQSPDGAKFCSKCGAPLNAVASQQPINTYAAYDQPAAVKDSGGFGWGVLGFFFPIVGLILYLVWKNEKPRTAKAVGKGALISVIICVVFYIIYFIIIGVFLSGMGASLISGLDTATLAI